jgi:Ricin-type beta-trefoil lectin domain
VVPVSPHTMVVTGVSSGRCLDDNSNLTVDGNRVQSWECNGTDAQKWAFGSDGTLRIHGLCLRPAVVANGGLMQTRSCDGGAFQAWQFRSDKSVFNPGSGLCLTDPGTDIHNQLTLATCSGSSGQKWSYT